MKNSILTKLLFLTLVFISSSVSASYIFTATLDGGQEVGSTPIDPGMGFASGELMGSVGGYVFTYSITYSNLSSPIAPIGVTGGHLHQAPAGTNGGVVHFLDTDFFNYTGTQTGTIMGEWRYDDAANPLTDILAAELLAGNIYINLHTETNMPGEIRGQFLQQIPEPTVWILMLAGIGWLGKTRLSIISR